MSKLSLRWNYNLRGWEAGKEWFVEAGPWRMLNTSGFVASRQPSNLVSPPPDRSIEPNPDPGTSGENVGRTAR